MKRKEGDLGRVIYNLVYKILEDKKIKQLLHNTGMDPYIEEVPESVELLHKNVMIIPKLPEEADEKQKLMNYVVVRLEEYFPTENKDFRSGVIRFDIICNMNNWITSDISLRPFAIADRIEEIFNDKKLVGIGMMRFEGAETLVVSPELSGYSYFYSITELN